MTYIIPTAANNPPEQNMSNFTVGQQVTCTLGKGTGFCRKGKKYTVADVSPSGYVRVNGNDNYYAPGRFVPVAPVAPVKQAISA